MAVETPLRGSCDLGSRLKGSPRAHDLPDPVEYRPFEAPTFGCGYKKRSLTHSRWSQDIELASRKHCDCGLGDVEKTVFHHANRKPQVQSVLPYHQLIATK